MNFGIIGAGGIARDFVKAGQAKAAKDAGVRFLAIAAREKSRADKFAEEFGIERAYGSYEELMSDPEIDAVYIAVTHNFHAEIAKACAKHKKAILCEKPFAIAGAEAVDAIACVRENGVLFMEAMWTRFLPTVTKAREWIADGKIGEVQLIDSTFSFYSERDPKSRLYDPKLAGGALLDVGVYCIAFGMGFAGAQLKSVAGVLQMGPTGVDEMNAASLLFENGVIVSFTSGTRATTTQNGYIYGTKGSIRLPMFWGGTHAELLSLGGEVVEVYVNEETTGRDSFIYEILHFAELWKSGKTESPIMPISDTLVCAHIFDELLKKN